MAKDLIEGCDLRPSSVSLLAVALALVIACGSASVIDDAGTTGLHVAVVVPHDAMSEIAGVLFEVKNESGEVREGLFSLEDEPFVCLLGSDFAGHACSDWLIRLEPGDYTVAATPLETGGSPSDRFAVARGGASVFPGMTSEIVLAGLRTHGTN